VYYNKNFNFFQIIDLTARLHVCDKFQQYSIESLQLGCTSTPDISAIKRKIL